MQEGRARRIADLEVAVRRIVVGYRAVAAAWLGLLALIGVGTGRLDAGAAALTTGIAVAWALATAPALASSRTGRRGVVWAGIAVDLAVAGLVVLLPVLLDSAAQPFSGGYPFSAVIVAAWLRGMPAAIAAGVWLSLVTALRVPFGAQSPPADLVSTVVFYLAGAAVLAWGIDILRRTGSERDAAEAALVSERADRVVVEERAAIAAHLHDSVLQTLALIQRRSADPGEVTSLARAQERALREWLSGRGSAAPEGSFAGALDAVAAEVESVHRLSVDVVHVGDAPLDDALAAALGATREALVNAAKHAGVPKVAVYAEVTAERVAIFVRDRGCGFDAAAVPTDRQGLMGSIVGRVAASGGIAEVRSMPGSGTEVEIRMPRATVGGVG